MKAFARDLFEYDTLRELLLYSNLIKEVNTQEEVYVIFEKWLMNDKSFNRDIRTLDEATLNNYKYYVLDIFEQCKLAKTFFSINSFKISLPQFMKKEEGILSKMQKEEEDNTPKLTPLSFSDFMNKDDKKEYYIKNIFAKGTINMIYAPPACMKSFVSYYMALCLCKGINFLNQKTKKVNVGYFDWENPISDVQNRVKGMCKGLKLDLNSIDNLFFFPKQPTLLKVNHYDSYVVTELKEQLLQFIEDNEIKVLFFDTLRRLGNFDENDSGAINTIKSELFDPLINKHDVCIVFLHHTNKEGKDYRGSVDIEGILDTAYSIKKNVKEDMINLVITNTKRRNNELEILNCSVTIDNEEYEEDGEMYEKITNVEFNKILEKEIVETNEYKAYKDYMIENLDITKTYKNKELSEMLSYNFSISSSKTHSRIIKWLTNINVLKSFGENRNKYYILNPAYSDNDEDIKLKQLEKHFFNMFNNNDLVSIQLLKDKFEDKYYSLMVSNWITKGWLNNAKKDYLGVTDIFREQHPQDKLDIDEDKI